MKRTDALYQSFVEILREELVPAMGCTEPIDIQKSRPPGEPPRAGAIFGFSLSWCAGRRAFRALQTRQIWYNR